MPKIKSHSGMKKRVYLTGRGKIKRRHAARSHNRIKKTTEQKQKMRRSLDVKKSDIKNVRRMTPYL